MTLSNGQKIHFEQSEEIGPNWYVKLLVSYLIMEHCGATERKDYFADLHVDMF